MNLEMLVVDPMNKWISTQIYLWINISEEIYKWINKYQNSNSKEQIGASIPDGCRNVRVVDPTNKRITKQTKQWKKISK